MPNWCECDLTVIGEPELLDDFAATMIKDAESETGPFRYFDFEGVLPMPAEIADTCEYYPPGKLKKDLSPAEQKLWGQPIGFTDEHGVYRALTDAEQAERVAKYGAIWWYDWAIKHWGTKWNASSLRIDGRDERELRIGFSTAWSPPVPVIAACAAKWPDLEFRLDGYEMGAAYQVHAVYRNGGCVILQIRHYDGDRGG